MGSQVRTLHRAPFPRQGRVRTIRDLPSQQESRLFGAAAIALVFLVWHLLTMPWSGGSRILSATLLPSLPDTLAFFCSLWFDRALTLNVPASLGREPGRRAMEG